MSRTVILNRLRRLADPSQKASRDLPTFPTYNDPVEKLASEFEAAGGVFLDARENGPLACLEEALRRTGVTEIFWEREDLFARYGVPGRLRDPLAFKNGRLVFSQHPRQKLTLPVLLHSKPWTRANLAEVPLSASSASLGIAETGTLLHEVAAGQGRLLSILPEAQLFLLSRKRVVQNPRELFERWQPRGGSLATLVTGPSRTADIEKTLVIGVHGPRQCLLVLTD